jgi:hypothetical protein
MQMPTAGTPLLDADGPPPPADGPTLPPFSRMDTAPGTPPPLLLRALASAAGGGLPPSLRPLSLRATALICCPSSLSPDGAAAAPCFSTSMACGQPRSGGQPRHSASGGPASQRANGPLLARPAHGRRSGAIMRARVRPPTCSRSPFVSRIWWRGATMGGMLALGRVDQSSLRREQRAHRRCRHAARTRRERSPPPDAARSRPAPGRPSPRRAACPARPPACSPARAGTSPSRCTGPGRCTARRRRGPLTAC